MVSDKRWVGIIVAVLMVSLCFINACSEKKTEEKHNDTIRR
jgi:hypothetical protein